MNTAQGDRPLKLGGKAFENVDDYVRAFLAAIRTHQRLTGTADLQVQVDPEGELPLAQRILLR